MTAHVTGVTPTNVHPITMHQCHDSAVAWRISVLVAASSSHVMGSRKAGTDFAFIGTFGPLAMQYAIQSVESSDSWCRVGRHAWCIDDDLWTYTIVFHGPLTLAEFEVMDTTLRAALHSGRVRFFLVDVADMPGLSADVRRRMGSDKDAIQPEGTIIVGAATPMRILANLVRRGLELLGRQRGTALVFCRDRREAHAWIRKRLGRASSHSIPN